MLGHSSSVILLKEPNQQWKSEKEVLFFMATLGRKMKKSHWPFKFYLWSPDSLGLSSEPELCIAKQSWCKCGSIHHWLIIVSDNVNHARGPDKLPISFLGTLFPLAGPGLDIFLPHSMRLWGRINLGLDSITIEFNYTLKRRLFYFVYMSVFLVFKHVSTTNLYRVPSKTIREHWIS